MALLLFYAALSIGVSFLCSILEAVLLSISPAYIASREADAPQMAEKLTALKADIDRPLAAILSLNTVAHTIGAAGVGAQAAYVFGDASLTIVSIVLTLAVLVFSEIIPKTIGATYWKGLAGFVASAMPILILITWPLVKMSQGITYLMGSSHGHKVSREELVAMAEIGHREGVVEEGESRIVRNLLALDTLTAKDVMTPRTVLFALQRDMTVGEVMETHRDMRFSRIPVFAERLDQIEGYVLKSEILLRAARDEDDVPMSRLTRKLAVVEEGVRLRPLFERLVAESEHMALVTDEYGGTAGLVTMEDVVETLLGLEITDEADDTTDLQALARQKWEERARRLGIEIDATKPDLEARSAGKVPAALDNRGNDRVAVVETSTTGGLPPEPKT